MTRPQPHLFLSYVEYAMALETYCNMLEIALDFYKLAEPAQNQQEIVHDPAEIRRVFEIDEADYPPPDSGFAKL